MVKAMATRMVAAMRGSGPLWAIGLAALVVLLGGTADVPPGISWT